MTELIFPNLSYRINGCLFEVQKELGYGHREKIYCLALEKEFLRKGLRFIKEFPVKINYKGQHIGINYLDFLIENKIVLEVKTGRFFKKEQLKQTIDYLKTTNKKLGIIANFSYQGVKFYRVLNLK